MMKKLLLSLIMMLVIGYTASAQQVNVTLDGQTVESGTTFQAGDNDYELMIEFYVTNTSDRAITVVFEKEEISIVEGTTNNFCCLGNCLGNDTPSASGVIEAGSGSEFSCHYMHNEIEGTSIVKYYIYEESNPDEKFVITVEYSYPVTSVDDYSDNKIFGNAYPSPANSQINFNYDLPATASNAVVVLYNMMGQEVKKQNIDGHFGTLSISVNDLSEGIYFYSLIVNNKTQKTSKVVISR